MTVIVGIATQGVKQKAIVLGADRARRNGQRQLVETLTYLALTEYESIGEFLEFLESLSDDPSYKTTIVLDRKIDVSPDNNSALAHTGNENEAHRRSRDFLLEPQKFLEDYSFLSQLLFPFPVDEGTKRTVIADYQRRFNLDEILLSGKIREIRRIFDLEAVKKYEVIIGGREIEFWDRNYHPGLSEYLIARSINLGEKYKPTLLDLSITGRVCRKPYWTNGSGGRYARKYIRDVLGTHEDFLGDSDTQPQGEINIEKAVDIVGSAVEYANKRDVNCRGFDYVVLTENGIETHFSDEQGEFELDLRELMESRLRKLNMETGKLKELLAAFDNK